MRGNGTADSSKLQQQNRSIITRTTEVYDSCVLAKSGGICRLLPIFPRLGDRPSLKLQYMCRVVSNYAVSQ